MEENIHNADKADKISNHYSTVHKSLDMLYEEAIIHLRNLNISHARHLIKRMTAMNPSHPHILVLEATIHNINGENRKSQIIMRHYLSIAKHRDPHALWLMGCLNLSCGKNQIALNQFTELLNMNWSDNLINTDRGNEMRILVKIANCKKRLGFLEHASKIYERLIIHPFGYNEYHKLMIEISHVNALNYNYSEVEKDMYPFISEPGNNMAKRLYVYALYKQKKYKKLLRCGMRDCRVDIYTCYLLTRSKMDDKCLTIDADFFFNILMKNCGKNYFILTAYGNYQAIKENLIGAIISYEEAIAVNHLYPPALRNLKLVRDLLKEVNYKERSKKECSDLIQIRLSRLIPSDVEPDQAGFFSWDSKAEGHCEDNSYNWSRVCANEEIDYSSRHLERQINK